MTVLPNKEVRQSSQEIKYVPPSRGSSRDPRSPLRLSTSIVWLWGGGQLGGGLGRHGPDPLHGGVLTDSYSCGGAFASEIIAKNSERAFLQDSLSERTLRPMSDSGSLIGPRGSTAGKNWGAQ